MTARRIPSAPPRTALCVPASVPRFVERARVLPVDMVILDLEDSVMPDAKESARAAVAAAFADDDWLAPMRAVRINALDSPWAAADLESLVPCLSHLDELVIPKVHGASDLVPLDTRLGQLEAKLGLPRGRTGLHVQVEDAAGLTAVHEVAAHPRVTTLAFGPVDFAASLGLRASAGMNDAYRYALVRMTVAARAHGKHALDGPHVDVHDADGLQESCDHAASLGLDGKWIIHPAQLDTTRRAFTPGTDEVTHARDVVTAIGSPASGAAGAVLVDGRMVDEATLKHAQRTLARFQLSKDEETLA